MLATSSHYYRARFLHGSAARATAVLSSLTMMACLSAAPRPGNRVGSTAAEDGAGAGMTAPVTSAAREGAPETPADSWRTYQDDVHGYSIRHPADAQVETLTPSATRFLFTKVFVREGNEIHDELSFDVRVFENPEGLSARAWVESRLVKDENMLRAKGNVSLGGAAGYQVDLWDVDETTHYVVVMSNERAYELSYVDPGSGSLAFPKDIKRTYDAIFRLMLESFRLKRGAPESK